MKNDDHRDIDLFLRNVEILMSSRLFEHQITAESSLSWDARTNLMKMTSTTPDSEDLTAMLLRLRKFTLHGGGSSLHRVFNICEREISSDAHRSSIRKAREGWKAERRTGTIAIAIDDDKYPPEEIFDYILNGVLFHDDSEALAKLQRLTGPLGLMAVQSFMGYIFGTVEAITRVASAIRQALADGSLK